MVPRGFRVIRAAMLVAIGLAAAGVRAQSAAEDAGESVFRVSLADVNACLGTLVEVEKALPNAAAPARALRKILDGMRATAGAPDDRLPVPAAFAANLAAGPYLQDVTSRSALIRWAALETDTAVRYGAGGRLTSVATATRMAAPRRMYEARLTGLDSGVEYAYSIHMGGADVRGTFRTAPDGDAPFTFAVWGDNRSFPKIHSAVARQMAAQPVDLALSTGDLVDVGLTDGGYYWEFFQPAGSFLRNVPFFVAVGNHELLGDPDLNRYRRFIRGPNGEKTYFAFTYANCRFIVLDSNDAGLYDGPQLRWLKDELASDLCRKARFRFLFLHHAPFSWDWYGGEEKVRRISVPLAEASSVDIVFGGHFHSYERGARTAKAHKTWYVVTGGGGGELTSPQRYGPGKHVWDFMAKHDWKYHFVLAEVDAKGLRARAIDDKGEEIDEFSLERAVETRPSRPRAPSPAQPSDPGQSAPAMSEAERRTCTLSGTDRAAALNAIKDIQEALGDQHADAAYRLAQVAAILEEARDSTREGTWAGPVERTMHSVPRLVNQGVHYRLKPSERAGAPVKALLDGIGEGRLTGTYEAAGLRLPLGAQRRILVDSIVRE